MGPKALEIKATIQEDYSRADIYFKSLNVQKLTQEKKYQGVRKYK